MNMKWIIKNKNKNYYKTKYNKSDKNKYIKK